MLSELKEKVVIYKGLCKGCGSCIKVCPEKALEMSSDKVPYLAQSKKCKSCGKCEYKCSRLAISVVKFRKTFLEKTVKFDECLSRRYRAFNARPQKKVIKLN